MDNFIFQSPTRFIFGRGAEKHTGDALKGRGKVLLHYGQGSIKKSGLYDTILESLKESDIDFVELGGVVPNPRAPLVREGIEICRKEKIGFILAVGGGSVIDSAKAIAAGFYYKGDVLDIFYKHLPIDQALPVGVVLTIPAAGSEASSSMVITDEDSTRKLSCTSQLLRPKFAIMNPELTMTLPEFQTACGVVDMMAHIFERYFTNTQGVDLTDKLCEATLRSIIKNARLILDEPDNYDTRAQIMWASTIAHNGILGTGRREDWASHRIEHQLSAHYDIAHGAGLAVIVPAWMRYVYKHDVARFAQFAREVWEIDAGSAEELAQKGIEATEKFFRELGLQTHLSELDINDSMFEQMAKDCGEPTGSFVRLKYKDIIEIFRLSQ